MDSLSISVQDTIDPIVKTTRTKSSVHGAETLYICVVQSCLCFAISVFPQLLTVSDKGSSVHG